MLSSLFVLIELPLVFIFETYFDKGQSVYIPPYIIRRSQAMFHHSPRTTQTHLPLCCSSVPKKKKSERATIDRPSQLIRVYDYSCKIRLVPWYTSLPENLGP